MFRDVEGGEVVVVGLDFGPLRDAIAEAGEDVDDLLDRALQRMAMAVTVVSTRDACALVRRMLLGFQGFLDLLALVFADLSDERAVAIEIKVLTVLDVPQISRVRAAEPVMPWEDLDVTHGCPSRDSRNPRKDRDRTRKGWRASRGSGAAVGRVTCRSHSACEELDPAAPWRCGSLAIPSYPSAV